MKKIYSKPAMQVEYFTMSQNIAAGCNAVTGGNSLGKPTHGDRGSCGWDVGGAIAWVGEGTGCNFPCDENSEANGVCFNNPSGGNTIFSS